MQKYDSWTVVAFVNRPFVASSPSALRCLAVLQGKARRGSGFTWGVFRTSRVWLPACRSWVCLAGKVLVGNATMDWALSALHHRLSCCSWTRRWSCLHFCRLHGHRNSQGISTGSPAGWALLATVAEVTRNAGPASTRAGVPKKIK